MTVEADLGFCPSCGERRRRPDGTCTLCDVQRRHHAEDGELSKRARRKAERRHERDLRRARKRQRRSEQAVTLLRFGRQVRPAAPIAIVTAFGMFGQALYAYAEIADPGWAVAFRLVVAIGVAVALESISLYVQWHAHDALLLKASATAGRLRRASYLIAFGLAAIQYSHFADPDWSPTSAAVAFAAFSALSPWLWGLHTRRAQRIQLVREGQVDAVGAVFSAERWRAFPVRTWMARRWSIDFGVDDPREAWARFSEHRDQRRAERRTLKAERRRERIRAKAEKDKRQDERAVDEPRPIDAPTPRAAPAIGTGTKFVPQDEAGDELPNRQAYVNTGRMDFVIADLRELRGRTGRRYSRDEVKTMYGISSERASEAIRMLGWSARGRPVRPVLAEDEPALNGHPVGAR